MRSIAPSIRIELEYADESAYGSAISGRGERTLKTLLQNVIAHRERYGMEATVRASRALLSEARAKELAVLFERPDRLRDDFLYPDASRVRPAAVVVKEEIGNVRARIPIERALATELAPLLGEFCRGAPPARNGAARALFDALQAAGALSDGVEAPPEPQDGVLFVGHATVRIGGETPILVDPFFPARSALYPASYQPLQAQELAPVGAVLITHSHPDHFDPASLWALGPDLPIYVPHVERESILAIDMAARLSELGFRSVQRVRPGDRLRIGASEVRVLPFYGEQPATGEVLHPEIRNVGCTYLVSSPGGRRILLIADSGRDPSGDVREVAQALAGEGGAHVLFGGHRAFALYPIQYVFSSVRRYLLFVPPSAWTVRQKTMNDGSDLLDVAEILGAEYAVPYSNGGAPWFWLRGVGPRLDGQGTPNPAIDPMPDQVERAAAARSSSLEGSIASPVRVLVLRPGSAASFEGETLRVSAGAEQAWPYGAASWVQVDVALDRSRRSAHESARLVFGALEPLLAAWRAQGRLKSCFFMRKQPDLRLRLLGDRALESEAISALAGLRECSAVERIFSSVYEPETERFGGPQAMDAVHAWFDADTTLWIAADRLLETSAASVPQARWCAAIAGDLVLRTLQDRLEAWAVWKAHANALAGRAPPAPALLDFEQISLSSVTSLATSDERGLLERYAAANGELASALIGIWSEGKLTRGLREVLGAVLVFHFHRYGLAAEAQWSIATAMASALSSA